MKGVFRTADLTGSAASSFATGNCGTKRESWGGFPMGRGTEYRKDGTLWVEGPFGEQSIYYGYQEGVDYVPDHLRLLDGLGLVTGMCDGHIP